MDREKSHVSDLEEELSAKDKAFEREFKRVTGSWHFTYGPIHIRGRIGTTSIFVFYASFISLGFLAGVVFCFFGGLLAALGAALVVGALFSFGSFAAQLWFFTQQTQSKVSESIFGEESLTELRKLAYERRVLNDQLKKLRPG